MKSQSRVSFVSGRQESVLRASKGIVLYESRNGEAFATVHGIRLDDGGRPVFMSGQAMTRETLIELTAKLMPDTGVDFLPPEVLAIGNGWMIWWCPSRERSLFFRTTCDDGIGKRTIRFTVPPLVFAAHGDVLRVYALKENARPRPETPLWMPPFYNVWDEGRLCRGNAPLPSKIGLEAMPQFESMFFDSVFTHPNLVSRKLTRHREGLTGLWRDIVSGRWKRFPLGMLAPSGRTLDDLVKSVKRGG